MILIHCFRNYDIHPSRFVDNQPGIALANSIHGFVGTYVSQWHQSGPYQCHCVEPHAKIGNADIGLCWVEILPFSIGLVISCQKTTTII